jgi:hypothetical protein
VWIRMSVLWKIMMLKCKNLPEWVDGRRISMARRALRLISSSTPTCHSHLGTNRPEADPSEADPASKVLV